MEVSQFDESDESDFSECPQWAEAAASVDGSADNDQYASLHFTEPDAAELLGSTFADCASVLLTDDDEAAANMQVAPDDESTADGVSLWTYTVTNTSGGVSQTMMMGLSTYEGIFMLCMSATFMPEESRGDCADHAAWSAFSKTVIKPAVDEA
jgi:hypothetical protein